MATKLDLDIDQGSKAAVIATAKDPDGVVVNLTGFTVRSHIRKSYRSSTFFTPTVEIVDAVNGQVQWTLESDTSINMKAGGYVYDIFVENTGGEDFRIVEGIINLRPAVTRPV